ncbi:TPA: hypothetical protein N0F65_007926 [Lagenidium giganteum]|uniref:Amino acid transporter transmembrane domain-containing protein n=1 Tax=Lagenidium giganteum TaxID=4803 RepID=A0AAV2YLA2_9STRA|nr:TPA: hypothetical protein N0F65_007926 [Lagenidium giganteum]
MGKPFFTLEDAKIAFNLFCCVYGIGTLSMPANFSRAGPALAVVAMLFMAIANIYASVVCSKVLLVAPRSVRTFGDLGEFCLGKPGRAVVIVSQMGVCLLGPCAFLVLGGLLLTNLFPGAFEQSTWIGLMALSVLPVCLIPTLKEGAGVAFAGCLGTLLADIIGITVLLDGMAGHPSVPHPDISFEQVATTFGSLSLAYGAGIVIPALQRQHSDPSRMPRVVGVTLTFISCLFLVLGSTGYSAVGCQIKSNLLFTIYPDAATKMTPLGFKADFGAVVIAYLSMQLHISIAFSLILHPLFYILERLVLGMHQRPESDIENAHFEAVTTPDYERKRDSSKNSVVSLADIEREDFEEDEAASYKGTAVVIRYIVLRVVVVSLLVIASVLLKKHFLDLIDFVGASCITLSCIILPIVFYLSKLWTKVPMYEKVSAILIIVICAALGGYVSYNSGKALFTPSDPKPTDPVFPFCHAEYQFDLYYNKTAARGL